ncbi:hypothetical protein AVEN_241395-1 [Araneus ventricosus]|uniref:Uncharacterized protein n=1 Tax=Araneus ventricosus TaxID=182803 RepID=A0A4Y2H231_ARAVE|nr:hypothetical protein AVEN_241395-1 [Araneus ventricosus]
MSYDKTISDPTLHFPNLHARPFPVKLDLERKIVISLYHHGLTAYHQATIALLPTTKPPWSYCLRPRFKMIRLFPKYSSATNSETTTFGRLYTGKGYQAMNHMSAYPEFFVRSRSENVNITLPFFTFPLF